MEAGERMRSCGAIRAIESVDDVRDAAAVAIAVVGVGARGENRARSTSDASSSPSSLSHPSNPLCTCLRPLPWQSIMDIALNDDLKFLKELDTDSA